MEERDAFTVSECGLFLQGFGGHEAGGEAEQRSVCTGHVSHPAEGQ